MNNLVYRTLVEKCGVKSGDRVIVALSGGADSVVLLNVLLEIQKELTELEIFAAHVNHNLRGEESQRDEAFVRKLCESKGVELFIHSALVGELAKDRGQSIELCAREVRYEFFAELSKKLGAKVATAHTLSDSEETMLYSICRGTTLHGLCSIPYKRDYIIRPLLDVTRTQVEEYCRDNGLSFVQDSTNFDEDMCKRNKLRLSVIPQLKNINEGFDKNFYRLREDLLLLDDFMQESVNVALKNAECEFGYSGKLLYELHPAVRRYALMSIIRNAGANAENAHIILCENILAHSGAVELPFGFVALCTQGVFRIKQKTDSDTDICIKISDNTEFTFNGRKFSAKKVDLRDKVYKKLASCCISCDKIKDSVCIRTRLEGDTFTLPKRKVTKPLRKLQNEMKIPKEERELSLVIADGSCILWAEHIGVALQGLCQENTKEGILIRVDADV